MIQGACNILTSFPIPPQAVSGRSGENCPLSETWRRMPQLRAADQNPDDKNKDSAYNHLECRAQKRCIHIPIADPTDQQQFNRDDHNSDCGRGSKRWDQVRERMSDSASGCAGGALSPLRSSPHP